MPLGQAPYGSRSPRGPDDDEPPRPKWTGDQWVRQGRWLFLLGGGAMIAMMASRDLGSKTKAVDTGECLTDKSCKAGWRCYAVPKDDPFAVVGACAQQCESDLQCPAHFRCEKVFVAKGQVVPEGARGATAEQTGVCRACGEGGCTPD